MNYAFPQAQSPRQLATIGGILAAHVLVLAGFLAAPQVHFKPAPKETVLMMVSTAAPVVPPTKIITNEKLRNPQTASIAQEVPVTKPETSDTIHLSAPVAAATETPQPHTNNAPTAPTTVTKNEAQGPKVISAVEYIQAPQADYPAMAKRMGEEGRVVMQVLVNDKGRAEKVDIIKSSGFNRLDESAKTALMRAVFKPYVEDGKSMSVLATASINFSLRG